MWQWFKQCASPQYFYQIATKLSRVFLLIFIILLLPALYWGLFLAPIDYQQGDAYRIMFVHVPAAWLSLFIYVSMAVMAFIALVWKIKLASVLVYTSASIGAGFTLITLITGAIWGKPMWGTWWVWDARLTSELILLFLYLGYLALFHAFDNPKKASQISNILVLVGVVNVPIIHYSVTWWNTLHQGASVTKLSAPSIHIDMLIPLLLMAVAFKVFYLFMLCYQGKYHLLWREQNSRWSQQAVLAIK